MLGTPYASRPTIGASATYYAGGYSLTTNPRDFFRAFPALEALTPRSFLERYDLTVDTSDDQG